MRAERSHRVGEVVRAVLERQAAERTRFLTEVCADEPALQREVESLLSTVASAGPAAERSPGEQTGGYDGGGWQQTQPFSPAAPPGLAEALGVKPRCVGKNRFDYLVEVDSERDVVDVRPDFTRLRSLPVRGCARLLFWISPERPFSA